MCVPIRACERDVKGEALRVGPLVTCSRSACQEFTSPAISEDRSGTRRSLPVRRRITKVCAPRVQLLGKSQPMVSHRPQDAHKRDVYPFRRSDHRDNRSACFPGACARSWPVPDRFFCSTFLLTMPTPAGRLKRSQLWSDHNAITDKQKQRKTCSTAWNEFGGNA